MANRLSSVVLASCALAFATLSIACGSASPERQSPDALLSGTHVKGGERIAWSQHATAEELKAAEFVVFVDDERHMLEDARCDQTSGADHECSARLPPLSSGRHLLEIAIKNREGTEGPRSPVMIVVMEAGESKGGK